MKKRKRNPLAMRMIAIGLLVCAVSFFSSDDNIAKGDLEESARKTYQIGENWQCAKQVDERMGALLFYDENTQAHRFLLYLKNGGIKGGYQLIKSDSSTYIENGVEGYAFQEKGMVLFSMNTEQVERDVCDKSSRTYHNHTCGCMEPLCFGDTKGGKRCGVVW